MSFCSPIHLLNDMALWFNPFLFNQLTESFRNYTNGDVASFDCGLTSSPCESNITKDLAFSSPTFVYWFDLFMVYVGLTVTSLVGIVGNLLNILIISTSSIASDSTNTLFLWLSVSDLVQAMGCGYLAVVCFLCFIDSGIAVSVFNFSWPYVFGNINRISLLSLDIVTVISIQRAVAVVFPFKISTIFTYRNTNIIIAMLIICNVAFCIPPVIGFYPRWVYHPYHDRVVSLGYSYRIFDYLVINDYVNTYFYVRSAVDLSIIFVVIPITIAKLHIQGKSRSKMIHATSLSPCSTTVTTSTSEHPEEQNSKSSNPAVASSKSVREVKVIRMSITVCIVTFIIFCFNIIVALMLQFYAVHLFSSPLPFATNIGGLLLHAVGASFNFFHYLAMSTQYREALVNMFKRLIVKK